MNTRFIKGLSLAAIGAAFVGQSAAFAHEHPHRDYGNFMLGVCVGESLQQAGVTLPQGQDLRSLDSTTKTALHEAIEACQAQRQDRNPQPTSTPAPTPTAAPALAPTPAPAPTTSATS